MNTVMTRFGQWLTFVVLAASTVALAQQKPADYPTRPIRIIIGVAPGAGADYVAKLTSDILIKQWGQNVVVDPRPGGGGVIASGIAAKAPPDGYTLYQNGFGLLFQGATKRVDFDVMKTFEPVVRTTSQPYILLAHLNLAATSVKELVALSAAKPLTYAGSSGVGSSVHIGMERLARVSGLKAKYVAYKGSSPAILALMGGEINMAATSAMSAVAAVKTGKVRAITSLGQKRVAVMPVTNQYNIWVPAKTPPAIIATLNQVISGGMNSPDIEKQLLSRGSEAVDPMPPKQLKVEIERDYADIQKSVKELGLTF